MFVPGSQLEIEFTASALDCRLFEALLTPLQPILVWKDVRPQQCRDSIATKLLTCFPVVDLAATIVLEIFQCWGSTIKAWFLAGTILRPLAMELER